MNQIIKEKIKEVPESNGRNFDNVPWDLVRVAKVTWQSPKQKDDVDHVDSGLKFVESVGLILRFNNQLGVLNHIDFKRKEIGNQISIPLVCVEIIEWLT